VLAHCVTPKTDISGESDAKNRHAMKRRNKPRLGITTMGRDAKPNKKHRR
jgi:hypothetical protein